MCGRTACTLAPKEICRKCQYTQNGKKVQPNWWQDEGKYRPSFNMSPGQNTPVLVSAKHFEEPSECERVILPMRWGLVPRWHKGDPNKVEYKMNNCRSDSMLQKASFKVPLQRGGRCVVLADGYYEWNTTEDGKKQPYFIYFPKDATSDTKELGVSVKSEKEEEKKTDEYDRSRLLTMAGVFDTWKGSDNKDGEPLYTYSVITVEASSSLSWLHHRMPAILETDEDVKQWLDFGEVPLKEAVSVIHPASCLQYHPVSTLVNNSRNNSPECVKAIDPNKKKTSASANMMQAWLGKGKLQDSSSAVSSSKRKSSANVNLAKGISAASSNNTVDKSVNDKDDEQVSKKPKIEN
ncbi:embryonic stem cell-specific 5-hydroxymethylcytosine-binding protein-like [Lingula anatina]|uniref:Abasic site processing protein HMCES n=1 Tax=Lingula anatina TaxID=7574 RepID=A0A2R2MRP2_LINAN|nr:embryonic stem cell-specific 5-hydroxymethylcytosine-binding protein-like [Lingula anatina]|eukprot:XP_023932919.1 embryonic stem cell-specific 5-hydroxymethylcytosine-binding protein-like [Lingula anatina]